MKSIKSFANRPISIPLAADDVTELHAARLLLLLYYCGGGKIEGLTKLAKLDFFVRYPDFFEQAANVIGKSTPAITQEIESSMVRHHYGPWDKRYYQVLAFLESRQLITVKKENKTYKFELTEMGNIKVKVISQTDSFQKLIEQMKSVKKVFGRTNGTKLKDIIYQVFEKEVKQRKLGEFIK